MNYVKRPMVNTIFKLGQLHNVEACHMRLRPSVPNPVGSRDGAVVEHSSPTQASHQCDPGSIPGLGIKCGLSLLLVLVLAPRGFSLGTPVFPSPQKPTFSNSNLIWNSRATGLSVLSSTVKCHPR